MFSVVIPLYNKAQYIEKAVESVLRQTYTTFELIIVDDGSTDNSLEKVALFTDSRLTIHTQQNSGVSTARNNGVRQAVFNYVAFLDADDWWEPDFLKEATNLIYNYNDADLFGTNYFYVKNGKARVEYKGLPDTFCSGYIDYILLYGTSLCVLLNSSFVIVKKKAFDQVGGFKHNLRLGEDFDLWIRLALIGKVAYLNKPLAYSNQDVNESDRAIGFYKLYDPNSHFIFNLSYLKDTEQASVDLKRLLDGLRVRSLLPYHLSGSYPTAVKSVLQEVDFSHQPDYFKYLYHSPLPLVRLYFGFRRVGSVVKQYLLRIRR